MGLDRSVIGRAGPAFQMPVERGKIREFARATKSAHPDYLHNPAPVIPVTFLTTAGFFWGYTIETPGDTPLAHLGIDTALLLHAGEEYEFFGPPPRTGTRLAARTAVVDAYERQGRRGGTLQFIVCETRFQDETGRLVAIGRTTVVQTEQAARSG